MYRALSSVLVSPSFPPVCGGPDGLCREPCIFAFSVIPSEVKGSALLRVGARYNLSRLLSGSCPPVASRLLALVAATSRRHPAFCRLSLLRGSERNLS